MGESRTGTANKSMPWEQCLVRHSSTGLGGECDVDRVARMTHALNISRAGDVMEIACIQYILVAKLEICTHRAQQFLHR